MCTVEEFNGATYDDDNKIMTDMVYQMDGEEVEDNSTKQSDQFYSHSINNLYVVNYVFPQCDLQPRIDTLMFQSKGGIPTVTKY